MMKTILRALDLPLMTTGTIIVVSVLIKKNLICNSFLTFTICFFALWIVRYVINHFQCNSE